MGNEEKVLRTEEDVIAYAGEKLGRKAVKAEEISGGNLNYAWRVSFEDGESVFLKQAPDYIKCLGPDFALTSDRIAREVEALEKAGEVSRSHVPKVIAFEAERCVVIMEDLKGMQLLRDDLMRGTIEVTVAKEVSSLVKKLGQLCTIEKNEAMCAITRDYVFTKPFVQNDPTNRILHTEDRLGRRAQAFRGDAQVLAAILRARTAFDTKRECLCHGDLHTGSIMTDGMRAIAIDWEFAFFGPSAFDPAFLVAGYCFIFLSAHFWARPDPNLAALRRRQAKLAIAALLTHYQQDDKLFFQELTAFAACELSRRVLGAASLPELSDIHDLEARTVIECAVLDLATSFLVKPPITPIALLATLDDIYDASLLFASPSSSSSTTKRSGPAASASCNDEQSRPPLDDKKAHDEQDDRTTSTTAANADPSSVDNSPSVPSAPTPIADQAAPSSSQS